MTKVVGVRFNMAGKIYYFDPCGAEVERGQHVIVETARGMEYGFVVGGVKEVDDSEIVAPLKPIIRVSTPEDDAHNAENLEKKKEAYAICKEKIKKHGLEMKLVDAEYTFDNNKLLFYFTADGRIDFRELVKDLAGVFRTHRTSTDWCARRNPLNGRNRCLRQSALLPQLLNGSGIRFH